MSGPAPRPRIVVVGLGPAGPEHTGDAARSALTGAARAFLRTGRHPAAGAFPGAATLDHHYERAGSFDEVYEGIVAELVSAAFEVAAGAGEGEAPFVAYAVPGSPLVAERTVALLRSHPLVAQGSLEVEVLPALSFLDLAWARLGVDPLDESVRLVDAGDFAGQAAGESGPFLVAQCWSKSLLSDVKLAMEPPEGTTVTVLHHLGLPDEVVRTVAWEELDRSVDRDHLTSLWVPRLTDPLAAEMVRLSELVRTLRVECPWDREQTHGSLARHLLEESYECLDAIDALAAFDRDAEEAGLGAPATATEDALVAHLEEELGDVLFQVCFHAALAEEAGRFSLADVARAVREKLVGRHPHVFGDVRAADAAEVAANWEILKKAEKGRASVTDGIPAALPALALAAKLQKKAESVSLQLPGMEEEAERIDDGLRSLLGVVGEAGAGDRGAVTEGTGDQGAAEALLGELLLSLANVARLAGVDPESALRSAATALRGRIVAKE